MANYFDQFDATSDAPQQQAPQAQSPYAGAVSSVESGGRYDAAGPATRTGDRAHGKYQIMGANIGPWTQEVLGKPMSVQEFVSSPEAQDAVFNAKFGSYVQKYGAEGAAKAWFAGEKGMNNPNARDVLGTTVAGYADKFNKAIGPQTMALAAPGTPAAAPAQAANFFDQFDNAPKPQSFDSRFAGMQTPSSNEPALQSGLNKQAAALTRGPETTPTQGMVLDYLNQGSAAGQGTTPIIAAHQPNLISADTFQNDAGDILYKDPQTGKVVPTDQNKHVVLRDPADNTLKVFARTGDTDEGRLSSAGRLINTGIASTAPTLRPGLTAATAASTAKSARAEAVQTLADEGVTAVTAGQKSGSKSLKYAESTLGDAFGAGGKATAANQKAAEQFTAATLRRAGIAGENRATSEVLQSAADRIGGTFDKIAAKNPSIALDGKFADEAQKAATDFKNLTGQDSPLITNILERIKGAGPAVELPPAGSTLSKDQFKALMQAGSKAKSGASEISGETYQTLSSEISRYMRQTSTPELKMALGDLKSALDAGVQRGLTDPKDAAIWQEARRQWKNLLVIENAATGAGEQAATGLISPQKLRQSVVAQGARAYVRGKSDFAGLAKAGNAVLSPLPDSGTAQRAASQMIPGLISGGVTGTALGPAGLAAVMAPGLTGRALMSPPVQRMLSPGASAASNPLAQLMLRGGQVPARLENQNAN